MKVEDIVPGKTYIGGNYDDSRTVVSYGASSDFVCWAKTEERLSLGRFVRTRCTSRKSFARWAHVEIPA